MFSFNCVSLLLVLHLTTVWSVGPKFTPLGPQYLHPAAPVGSPLGLPGGPGGYSSYGPMHHKSFSSPLVASSYGPAPPPYAPAGYEVPSSTNLNSQSQPAPSSASAFQDFTGALENHELKALTKQDVYDLPPMSQIWPSGPKATAIGHQYLQLNPPSPTGSTYGLPSAADIDHSYLSVHSKPAVNQQGSYSQQPASQPQQHAPAAPQQSNSPGNYEVAPSSNVNSPAQPAPSSNSPSQAGGYSSYGSVPANSYSNASPVGSSYAQPAPPQSSSSSYSSNNYEMSSATSLSAQSQPSASVSSPSTSNGYSSFGSLSSSSYANPTSISNSYAQPQAQQPGQSYSSNSYELSSSGNLNSQPSAPSSPVSSSGYSSYGALQASSYPAPAPVSSGSYGAPSPSQYYTPSSGYESMISSNSTQESKAASSPVQAPSAQAVSSYASSYGANSSPTYTERQNTVPVETGCSGSALSSHQPAPVSSNSPSTATSNVNSNSGSNYNLVGYNSYGSLPTSSYSNPSSLTSSYGSSQAQVPAQPQSQPQAQSYDPEDLDPSKLDLQVVRLPVSILRKLVANSAAARKQN